MSQSLQELVISHLLPIINEKLTKVYYFVLPLNLTPEEIAAPYFYTDGQILLEFTNNQRVFVTWIQNHNSEIMYIIQTTETSAFDASFWEKIDASDVLLWKPLISKSLVGVEVFGNLDLPNFIKFKFEETDIFLGTGYEEYGFGDGDGIIVCTEIDFYKHILIGSFDKLWSSQD